MEPWAPIGFIISAALLLLAGWVWALDICIYGPPSACKEKRKKAKRKGKAPWYGNLTAFVDALERVRGILAEPGPEWRQEKRRKAKRQRDWDSAVASEMKLFSWKTDGFETITIFHYSSQIGHVDVASGMFHHDRDNSQFMRWGTHPATLAALGLFLKRLPKSQRRT